MAPAENTGLTRIEKETLSNLEETIKKGLSSFYEVGSALLKIRDSSLYRDTHGTFESYCKERWGFTKSRANQLIGSAKVSDALTTIVAKPTHESQVRPLTALPKEEQAEVWQEAVETAPEGRVTARHVNEIIRKRHLEHPEETSDAKYFAKIAISQLERIRADDPYKVQAGEMVIKWIKDNLL